MCISHKRVFENDRWRNIFPKLDEVEFPISLFFFLHNLLFPVNAFYNKSPNKIIDLKTKATLQLNKLPHKYHGFLTTTIFCWDFLVWIIKKV